MISYTEAPVKERAIDLEGELPGCSDHFVGFSYLQVYEGQMENFAPLVVRLTGK